MKTNPERLMAAAIAGDRTALSQLLLVYYDELERHIARRISPRLQGFQRPEDILQQTFIHAARGIGAFAPRRAGSFRAWLKTIADNVLRDAEKRRRRERHAPHGDRQSQSHGLDRLPTETSSPSVQVQRLERAERLRVAMEQLPPEQKEILQRRYLQGQSIARIAEETGRTIGAVRGLCFRARSNLHVIMGDTSLYFSK